MCFISMTSILTFHLHYISDSQRTATPDVGSLFLKSDKSAMWDSGIPNKHQHSPCTHSSNLQIKW